MPILDYMELDKLLNRIDASQESKQIPIDKVVFVDFDDTLFFTKHIVEEAAEIMLRKKLTKDEIRKLPRELKSKIYDKAFNEFYYKATPNFRLIEILKKYREIGYKIIILTARSENNRKITEELLIKYKVPYDGIITRSDLSIKDEEWKSRIIRSYPAKEIILFEDKIDNIEYILKNVNKQVKAYLVLEEDIKEATKE